MLRSLRRLRPWPSEGDFDAEDWQSYLRAARRFQAADPSHVAAVLEAFVEEALEEEYRGCESESKPFLLLRVMFDLPREAPAALGFSFKGWSNWPEPDSRGNLSLSWPVAWSEAGPRLAARYRGSMGKPYAAAAEFRFLRARFPMREL